MNKFAYDIGCLIKLAANKRYTNYSDAECEHGSFDPHEKPEDYADVEKNIKVLQRADAAAGILGHSLYFHYSPFGFNPLHNNFHAIPASELIYEFKKDLDMKNHGLKIGNPMNLPYYYFMVYGKDKDGKPYVPKGDDEHPITYAYDLAKPLPQRITQDIIPTNHSPTELANILFTKKFIHDIMTGQLTVKPKPTKTGWW